MRGHQISFDLSQSQGWVHSPAFRAQVPLGNTFPSLQLRLPPVLAYPVPGPARLGGMPGRLCANPQHPGHFWAGTGRTHCILVSQRLLFLATPQVQICLIYLEEDQRKPTPATAPNQNTPSYIPCGKCQQVPPQSPQRQRKPSSGPQEQDRWATGLPREPTTRHRSSPHLDQEPKVSARKAGAHCCLPTATLHTQIQGTCRVLTFPPLFCYLIMKIMCHHCEISFSRI